MREPAPVLPGQTGRTASSVNPPRASTPPSRGVGDLRRNPRRHGAAREEIRDQPIGGHRGAAGAGRRRDARQHGARSDHRRGRQGTDRPGRRRLRNAGRAGLTDLPSAAAAAVFQKQSPRHSIRGPPRTRGPCRLCHLHDGLLLFRASHPADRYSHRDQLHDAGFHADPRASVASSALTSRAAIMHDRS